MARSHLLACALFACSKPVEKPPEAPRAPAAKTPLFDGMGPHTRTITTAVPLAQRYFDQGLALLYAFNHDEAIRSFEEAARQDPTCAMAHWGIALAHGPHINYPMMPPERTKAAWAALAEARKHGEKASEVERALIEALAPRYAEPPPDDRKPLDQAYAEAMRKLRQKYPTDADIGALFAEALMDLRPWDLYGPDGKARPETPEILATLESVIAQHPRHPLALHLYIHATEMSPAPEKADAAADALRELSPGLGHLLHMPSHIDVRRGRWQAAIVANTKAIEADGRYRAKSEGQAFYRFYMAHNFHMRAFAAMMTGQKAEALRTIDEMVKGIPEGWAKDNAEIIDGFMAMPLEVRMRFGLWEEILAAAELPEHFPIARALGHYARGVAYAATDRAKEARLEQTAFNDQKRLVNQTATFGNNAALDLLAVAERVLEGEILYREKKVPAAVLALRKGVELEDKLRYDEPPDWIQPVRHPLGAVLLSAQRYKEAEEVFRADLKKLPNNGWALYGLSRTLAEQSRPEASEVRKQFDQIWGKADFPLSSPCLCVRP